MLVGTLNVLVWLLLLAVVAVLMAMVAWYLVSGEYRITLECYLLLGGGGRFGGGDESVHRACLFQCAS